MNKKYIWLNPAFYNNEIGSFCVAEFKRELEINGSYEIKITANARYMLFVNDCFVGRGPTSVGGDFLNFAKINEPYYETYKLSNNGKVEIKAIVTSIPTAMTEYNFEHSGLWVEIRGDGFFVESDEDWEVRPLNERLDVYKTDYTRKELPFTKAIYTQKSFCVIPSPIEHLTEEKIHPTDFEKITVNCNESLSTCLFFDKIYSAYPNVSISCNGKCTVKMISSEEGTAGIIEELIITDKSVNHFSPRMRSIGQIELEIINESNEPLVIEDVYIDYVHYPVYDEGKFECSDKLLNEIYDVCMHTLKICRQTIHLDSPTHQEPLACTGDYYIQSLIEYLSLGDSTLAKWDIKRTGKLLQVQNGRLFHTTYSLIYPWWIYDHYMHTMDASVIDTDSLNKLFELFDTYASKENGLLEYAPDYMFVDWVVASDEDGSFLDGGSMMNHGKMKGFSLHHPPKALGQSVLCMLYYNALVKANDLYKISGDEKSADTCLKKAENIKKSINKYLFDEERGLYVGGLNTPNLVLENEWLPKNTDIVYYLKQANALAVLFEIAPKEKRQSILEYVVRDLSKYEMQPYFYHYLLCALYNEGMFGKYGLPLIRRYESLLKKCNKGLSEAWENMKCDYSHAWGATPAYMLKKALSGLEILEPSFKRVRLSPCLYDLDYAEYEITTPFGKIEICHKKGEKASIKAPKGVIIE